eukprot:TRINITY_DN1001_c5_g1_i1.p1 TRINITY_DN1001_c5_g1~~TRINITY_DN1001_c5_g1_i1.p1  ORF type:complete len:5101 (+),score=1640.56 TRINITY_DN1001_c5_g1_i1:2112-15305(+)
MSAASVYDSSVPVGHVWWTGLRSATQLSTQLGAGYTVEDQHSGVASMQPRTRDTTADSVVWTGTAEAWPATSGQLNYSLGAPQPGRKYVGELVVVSGAGATAVLQTHPLVFSSRAPSFTAAPTVGPTPGQHYPFSRSAQLHYSFKATDLDTGSFTTRVRLVTGPTDSTAVVPFEDAALSSASGFLESVLDVSAQAGLGGLYYDRGSYKLEVELTNAAGISTRALSPSFTAILNAGSGSAVNMGSLAAPCTSGGSGSMLCPCTNLSADWQFTPANWRPANGTGYTLRLRSSSSGSAIATGTASQNSVSGMLWSSFTPSAAPAPTGDWKLCVTPSAGDFASTEVCSGAVRCANDLPGAGTLVIDATWRCSSRLQFLWKSVDGQGAPVTRQQWRVTSSQGSTDWTNFLGDGVSHTIALNDSTSYTLEGVVETLVGQVSVTKAFATDFSACQVSSVTPLLSLVNGSAYYTSSVSSIGLNVAAPAHAVCRVAISTTSATVPASGWVEVPCNADVGVSIPAAVQTFMLGGTPIYPHTQCAMHGAELCAAVKWGTASKLPDHAINTDISPPSLPQLYVPLEDTSSSWPSGCGPLYSMSASLELLYGWNEAQCPIRNAHVCEPRFSSLPSYDPTATCLTRRSSVTVEVSLVTDNGGSGVAWVQLIAGAQSQNFSIPTGEGALSLARSASLTLPDGSAARIDACAGDWAGNVMCASHGSTPLDFSVMRDSSTPTALHVHVTQDCGGWIMAEWTGAGDATTVKFAYAMGTSVGDASWAAWKTLSDTSTMPRNLSVHTDRSSQGGYLTVVAEDSAGNFVSGSVELPQIGTATAFPTAAATTGSPTRAAAPPVGLVEGAQSNYTVIQWRYCSNQNIGVSADPDQCFVKCGADTELAGCSGALSTFTPTSAVLCANETVCRAKCDAMTNCYGIDMHRYVDRCSLNGEPCRSNLLPSNDFNFMAKGNSAGTKRLADSETCAGSGCSVVATPEECADAALGIGLQTTAAAPAQVSTADAPAGCQYNETSSSLVFNALLNSTGNGTGLRPICMCTATDPPTMSPTTGSPTAGPAAEAACSVMLPPPPHATVVDGGGPPPTDLAYTTVSTSVTCAWSLARTGTGARVRWGVGTVAGEVDTVPLQDTTLEDGNASHAAELVHGTVYYCALSVELNGVTATFHSDGMTADLSSPEPTATAGERYQAGSDVGGEYTCGSSLAHVGSAVYAFGTACEPTTQFTGSCPAIGAAGPGGSTWQAGQAQGGSVRRSGSGTGDMCFSVCCDYASGIAASASSGIVTVDATAPTVSNLAVVDATTSGALAVGIGPLASVPIVRALSDVKVEWEASGAASPVTRCSVHFGFSPFPLVHVTALNPAPTTSPTGSPTLSPTVRPDAMFSTHAGGHIEYSGSCSSPTAMQAAINAEGVAATLPVSGQAYTIDLWVKPTNVTGEVVVLWWGTSAAKSVGLSLINGGSGVRHWWGFSGSALTANYGSPDEPGYVGLVDGTWHRLVATWDGAARRVYVDGTLLGFDSPGGGAFTADGSSGFALGCSSGSAPVANFYGRIRDAYIYRTHAYTLSPVAASPGRHAEPLSYGNQFEFSNVAGVLSTPSADATIPIRVSCESATGLVSTRHEVSVALHSSALTDGTVDHPVEVPSTATSFVLGWTGLEDPSATVTRTLELTLPNGTKVEQVVSGASPQTVALPFGGTGAVTVSFKGCNSVGSCRTLTSSAMQVTSTATPAAGTLLASAHCDDGQTPPLCVFDSVGAVRLSWSGFQPDAALTRYEVAFGLHNRRMEHSAGGGSQTFRLQASGVSLESQYDVYIEGVDKYGVRTPALRVTVAIDTTVPSGGSVSGSATVQPDGSVLAKCDWVLPSTSKGLRPTMQFGVVDASLTPGSVGALQWASSAALSGTDVVSGPPEADWRCVAVFKSLAGLSHTVVSDAGSPLWRPPPAELAVYDGTVAGVDVEFAKDDGGLAFSWKAGGHPESPTSATYLLVRYEAGQRCTGAGKDISVAGVSEQCYTKCGSTQTGDCSGNPNTGNPNDTAVCATAKRCRELCDADAECYGFDMHQGSPLCYLRKAGCTLSAAAGWIFAYNPADAPAALTPTAAEGAKTGIIVGGLSGGERFYVEVDMCWPGGACRAGVSDGVQIDRTNPAAGTISVVGADGVYKDNCNAGARCIPAPNSMIQVRWSGFSDGVSGIARYEVSVRRNPGDPTTLLGPVNAGLDTAITLHVADLFPNNGSVGQFSAEVTAVDGVGLQSAAVQSGVVWAESRPPTVYDNTISTLSVALGGGITLRWGSNGTNLPVFTDADRFSGVRPEGCVLRVEGGTQTSACPCRDGDWYSLSADWDPSSGWATAFAHVAAHAGEFVSSCACTGCSTTPTDGFLERKETVTTPEGCRLECITTENCVRSIVWSGGADGGCYLYSKGARAMTTQGPSGKTCWTASAECKTVDTRDCAAGRVEGLRAGDTVFACVRGVSGVGLASAPVPAPAVLYDNTPPHLEAVHVPLVTRDQNATFQFDGAWDEDSGIDRCEFSAKFVADSDPVRVLYGCLDGVLDPCVVSVPGQVLARLPLQRVGHNFRGELTCYNRAGGKASRESGMSVWDNAKPSFIGTRSFSQAAYHCAGSPLVAAWPRCSAITPPGESVSRIDYYEVALDVLKEVPTSADNATAAPSVVNATLAPTGSPTAGPSVPGWRAPSSALAGWQRVVDFTHAGVAQEHTFAMGSVISGSLYRYVVRCWSLAGRSNSWTSLSFKITDVLPELPAVIADGPHRDIPHRPENGIFYPGCACTGCGESAADGFMSRSDAVMAHHPGGQRECARMCIEAAGCVRTKLDSGGCSLYSKGAQSLAHSASAAQSCWIAASLCARLPETTCAADTLFDIDAQVDTRTASAHWAAPLGNVLTSHACVGRTASDCSARNWTALAPADTNVTFTGMDLLDHNSYVVRIRGCSRCGHCVVVTSDGFTVDSRRPPRPAVYPGPAPAGHIGGHPVARRIVPSSSARMHWPGSAESVVCQWAIGEHHHTDSVMEWTYVDCVGGENTRVVNLHEGLRFYHNIRVCNRLGLCRSGSSSSVIVTEGRGVVEDMSIGQLGVEVNFIQPASAGGTWGAKWFGFHELHTSRVLRYEWIVDTSGTPTVTATMPTATATTTQTATTTLPTATATATLPSATQTQTASATVSLTLPSASATETGSQTLPTVSDTATSTLPTVTGSGTATTTLPTATAEGTQTPSLTPTLSIPLTDSPTTGPTRGPTKAPTLGPTRSPTRSPTGSPSKSPTKAPSGSPVTSAPSAAPVPATAAPTTAPTAAPTMAPTVAPSSPPSAASSASSRRLLQTADAACHRSKHGIVCPRWEDLYDVHCPAVSENVTEYDEGQAHHAVVKDPCKSTLLEGHRYRIVVRAVYEDLTMHTVASDGVVVTTEVPTNKKVYLPEVVSSLMGLEVRWEPFVSDHGSERVHVPIVRYRVRLVSQEGHQMRDARGEEADAQGWVTTGAETSYTFVKTVLLVNGSFTDDIEAVEGTYFHAEVQACNEAGICGLGTSDQSIVQQTLPVAPVVRDGSDMDKDADNSIDNATFVFNFLPCLVPANPSLAARMRHEWCIGTVPGVCDVTPYQEIQTNGSNQVVNASGLSLAVEQKYFANVRCWTLSNVPVWSSSNGLLILSAVLLTESGCGSVYFGLRDRISQEYQSDTERAAVHWVDQQAAFGDSEIIDFSVILEGAQANRFSVGKFAQHYEWSGLLLEHGSTYMAKVFVINEFGQSCQGEPVKAILVDTTPPDSGSITMPTVVTSKEAAELTLVDPGSDPESGIEGWSVAVGTTPLGTQAMAYQDIPISAQKHKLTSAVLVSGATYYVTFVTRNGAGLTNATQVVFRTDFDPPVIEVALTETAKDDAEGLTIEWTVTDDSPVGMEVSLTLYGSLEAEYTASSLAATGSLTIAMPSGTPTVQAVVTAVDAVGIRGTKFSPLVARSTAPQCGDVMVVSAGVRRTLASDGYIHVPPTQPAATLFWDGAVVGGRSGISKVVVGAKEKQLTTGALSTLVGADIRDDDLCEYNPWPVSRPADGKAAVLNITARSEAGAWCGAAVERSVVWDKLHALSGLYIMTCGSTAGSAAARPGEELSIGWALTDIEAVASVEVTFGEAQGAGISVGLWSPPNVTAAWAETVTVPSVFEHGADVWLSVAAMSFAGLERVQTMLVAIDTLEPDLSDFVVTLPRVYVADDDSGNATLQVQWAGAVDTDSGLCSAAVGVAPPGGCAALNMSQMTVGPHTTTAAVEVVAPVGDWDVCVRVVDRAGNTALASPVPVTVRYQHQQPPGVDLSVYRTGMVYFTVLDPGFDAVVPLPYDLTIEVDGVVAVQETVHNPASLVRRRVASALASTSTLRVRAVPRAPDGENIPWLSSLRPVDVTVALTALSRVGNVLFGST